MINIPCATAIVSPIDSPNRASGDLFRVVSTFQAFLIAFAILAAPCLSHARPLVKNRLSISNPIKRVGTIVRGGISKLPSASQAAAAKRETTTKSLTPFDVSGTPPSLSVVASAAIEDIFWRPNVVSSIAFGTASALQCSEFFLGASDGASGGLRVCELAEGIGYSFQTLLNAEATLCYMKSLPTLKNLRTGAVTIVSGKKNIPDGDFSKIFVPRSTSRLVKITVPVIEQVNTEAKQVFVRVHSIAQNNRSKRFYDAEIFSCLNNEQKVADTTRVIVDDAARLSIRTGSVKTPLTNGSMNTFIKGTLRPVGSGLAWNLSRQRTITINSLASESENFKSAITIAADNILTIKRRNFYTSTINKEFSASRFSGDSAQSFLFLAGALKAAFVTASETSPYSGAAEYRDSYYAAAPASGLIERINEFDLSADSFFQSDPSIEAASPLYSCAADADIELSLNASNETLRAALEPCASNVLTGMDFCARSDLVSQALQNYSTSCPR